MLEIKLKVRKQLALKHSISWAAGGMFCGLPRIIIPEGALPLGNRFPHSHVGRRCCILHFEDLLLNLSSERFPFVCGCFKDSKLGLHPTILNDLKLNFQEERLSGLGLFRPHFPAELLTH